MNGVDENSSTSSFIKSIKLNYKYYIGGGYQIWTDMVFKYRKILGLLCLPISPNPHNKKNGSSNWTRTSDIRINSPSFYRLNYRGIIIGPGDTIWTCDILLPKQALYQAELHLDNLILEFSG